MSVLSKIAEMGRIRAMVAQGMPIDQAVRAAYPDYTDEQVMQMVSMLQQQMGGGPPQQQQQQQPMAGGPQQQQQQMGGGPIPQAADTEKGASVKLATGALGSARRAVAASLPGLVAKPGDVKKVYREKGKAVGVEDPKLQMFYPVSTEKKGSVNIFALGLRSASEQLYDYHLEKNANILGGLFGSATKGVGTAAVGGGLLGGLAGLGGRAKWLHSLARDPAKSQAAWHAGGEAAALRAADPGAILTGAQKRSLRVRDFIKSEGDLVRGGATLKSDPMGYLKAYAGEMAPFAAETGLTGAALASGGKLLANWRQKQKMMQKAKDIALPAAAGLGAYALLS